MRPASAAGVQPYYARRGQGLLEAFRDDRLEALYSVAMAVGLRQGEALGLQWPDMDFEAGTLRCGTPSKCGRQISTRQGQDPEEPTTINLPKFALRPCSGISHGRTNAPSPAPAGRKPHTSSPPDRNPAGRVDCDTSLPASPQGRWPWKLRFHDFRHTCASLLLAQGVHPRVIMEILGHIQIASDEPLRHIIPAMKSEAADKMDAILSPSVLPALLPNRECDGQLERKLLKRLVGPVGFEPTTNGL